MTSRGTSKGVSTGKGSTTGTAKVQPSLGKKKVSDSPSPSPQFNSPDCPKEETRPSKVYAKAMPPVPPLPGANTSVTNGYLQSLADAAGCPDALATAGLSDSTMDGSSSTTEASKNKDSDKLGPDSSDVVMTSSSSVASKLIGNDGSLAISTTST